MFTYIKNLTPYLRDSKSLDILLRRDSELFSAKADDTCNLNQRFLQHAQQKLDKLLSEGWDNMRFNHLITDTAKFQPFLFLHYRALMYLKNRSEALMQSCVSQLEDLALSMNSELMVHNALSDNVPLSIAESNAQKEAEEAAKQIVFPQEVVLPFLKALYAKSKMLLNDFRDNYDWLIEDSWEQAAVGERATERLIQLLEMPQEQFEQTWSNLENHLPVKDEYDNLEAPKLQVKQVALLFFYLQAKGAISNNIDKKTLAKHLRPLTGYSHKNLRIALSSIFSDLEHVKNGRYQDDKEEVLALLNAVTKAVKDA